MRFIMLLTIAAVLGGGVAGCGVYDTATKGLARSVSPEYRAYEAQQAAQQKAAEERKLCEKSRC